MPGEGIGEGKYERAAGVVPLERLGAPGKRHAARIVTESTLVQQQHPVLLVLLGSPGQAVSR